MMDVMQAIRMRRSVRKYNAEPIPEALLTRLLEALRLAPSACNYQPWRFIIVRDPPKREALGHAARDQMFIAQAPVIVVACGYPDKAYKKMGGSGNSIDLDLAIALDHLMLAAAAEGLGTCWIGAFDEQAVRNVLDIPSDVKVVAMTPLGYPAQAGLLHETADGDRKKRDLVMAFDGFGGP